MELEDLEPRKKQPTLKDLTVMGLEELAEYRQSLEAEIASSVAFARYARSAAICFCSVSVAPCR